MSKSTVNNVPEQFVAVDSIRLPFTICSVRLPSGAVWSPKELSSDILEGAVEIWQ